MSKDSVKKNFAYQMIYEVLVLILPLLTSPYVARTIGAKGLGTYSYSYSVACYFVLFSMLGLKNYGNRAIAQSRDEPSIRDNTFSNILAMHVLVSLLCCVAYIVYILLLQEDRIYAIIQGAYVISGLFDISWFYFGIEKFKLTVACSSAIKLINALCIFLFVRNANDLWKYCAIMAVGMLISQIILWIPLKKYVRFTRPNVHDMCVHMKPMLVLFIPAIAVSLYKYMDKIMIGALSSKTQLGFYENAEKAINIPLTVISSFGTVMLPRMSNLMNSFNHNAASKYIMISMRYLMCLSIAFAFGLASVGSVFAPVFWGREFLPSGTVIMGLAITVPFISFANVIRTQFLIPTERDREYVISVVAGAIINLCINWVLIPSMGSLGAMIGTIAAEVAVCCIQAFEVRRQLALYSYFKNAVPFAVFGLVMFAVVYLFGQANGATISTLIEQIMIGVTIYGSFCAAYLYATREQIFMESLKEVRKRLPFRL